MLSLTVCWVISDSLLLALLKRKSCWVWFIDDIPAMKRKAEQIKEKRGSAGVKAKSLSEVAQKSSQMKNKVMGLDQ